MRLEAPEAILALILDTCKMKSALCILKVSLPVHRNEASTKGLAVALSRRAGAEVRGNSACTWSRKFIAAATADVVQITARDTDRTKAFMALLRGFWIENYRSPGCRGAFKASSPPQSGERDGAHGHGEAGAARK